MERLRLYEKLIDDVFVRKRAHRCCKGCATKVLYVQAVVQSISNWGLAPHRRRRRHLCDWHYASFCRSLPFFAGQPANGIRRAQSVLSFCLCFSSWLIPLLVTSSACDAPRVPEIRFGLTVEAPVQAIEFQSKRGLDFE